MLLKHFYLVLMIQACNFYMSFLGTILNADLSYSEVALG